MLTAIKHYVLLALVVNKILWENSRKIINHIADFSFTQEKLRNHRDKLWQLRLEIKAHKPRKVVIMFYGRMVNICILAKRKKEKFSHECFDKLPSL